MARGGKVRKTKVDGWRDRVSDERRVLRDVSPMEAILDDMNQT